MLMGKLIDIRYAQVNYEFKCKALNQILNLYQISVCFIKCTRMMQMNSSMYYCSGNILNFFLCAYHDSDSGLP